MKGGSSLSPRSNRRENVLQRTKSVAQFARDLGDDQVQSIKGKGTLTQLSELKRLIELFDLCDADKDGQITQNELRRVFKELSIQVNEKEFISLFKALDTNHDDRISFGDFLSGFRWTQKSLKLAAMEDGGASPEHKEKGSSSPKTAKAGSTTPPTPKSKLPPRLQRRDSVVKFLRETPLSDTQLGRMKELFAECDVDGDGAISKQELWTFLRKQGVEPSKEEFVVFFEQLDEENTGALSFSKFAKGIMGLKKGLKISKEKPAPLKRQKTLEEFVKGYADSEPSGIKDLFNQCDKDGNGYIERSELAEVMRELGVKASSEQIDTLFMKLDTGKKGHITFHDFTEGLGWLNKGMTLLESPAAKGRSKKESELAKQHEVLLTYMREFIASGLRMAEKEQASNPRTTKALLELINYPLAQQMEEFVGGKLTDKALDDTFARLSATKKAL